MTEGGAVSERRERQRRVEKGERVRRGGRSAPNEQQDGEAAMSHSALLRKRSEECSVGGVVSKAAAM